MKAPAALRTERLLLRQWREDDLASFADPEVMEFLTPLPNAEACTGWAARLVAHWREHGFGRCHLLVIAVLGLVGFIDGYDLVMTGSLLVLAKGPLHLSPGDVRFLAIASTLMICIGGFMASATISAARRSC